MSTTSFESHFDPPPKPTAISSNPKFSNHQPPNHNFGWITIDHGNESAQPNPTASTNPPRHPCCRGFAPIICCYCHVGNAIARPLFTFEVSDLHNIRLRIIDISSFTHPPAILLLLHSTRCQNWYAIRHIHHFFHVMKYFLCLQPVSIQLIQHIARLSNHFRLISGSIRHLARLLRTRF